MSEPYAVEDLCEDLRRRAKAADGRIDLWVPDELTIGGEPEPQHTTGLALAHLLDAALSVGLWPDGFTDGAGGRTYHYRAA